ncbi:RDD family protein [Clostridium chromiireducens]|uniref:RDD family protein n=1 Tax=Clostridium chromiireducens TaxID=225345 RepID=A0A1V4IHD1_9CLOT|nr:RDD family protein [Clostridium chromiireducens]OPJ59085.1 hypothetical protein CLCHR_36880 [Clostridium chromiireducens]RII32563.1 RDD family protein [Clostridium chromiireducens]
MENENIKENKISSEVEETEMENLNPGTDETAISAVADEKTNAEYSNTQNELITGEKSSMRSIVASALDQLLIVAGSALLLLLCDLILKLFGYMFVRENGALILAGGIIYFIINCIYIPIMERSKLEVTIAKRILNIN